MDFVNNWGRPVTLAAGATSLALDLPDGTYRVTLASGPSAAPAWEIVDAVVAAGTATLTRGVEGTSDQNWPAGSTIYCSLTAGVIGSIFSRLASLQASIDQAANDMGALSASVTSLGDRVTSAESGLSDLDGRVTTNESAITDLDTRVTALEPAPVLNGYVLRWIYSNGDSILTHVSPFAGAMEYAPLDLGYFSAEGATLLADYNGAPAVALNGSGEYVTELGMAYDAALTMFRITFNPNNRYADVTARIELDGNVLGETVFNSGSEGANPSVIEITIQ